MKDFITEAWLRANHTLSEGAEIHLPADSRLTHHGRMGVEIFYCTHGVMSGSLILNGV